MKYSLFRSRTFWTLVFGFAFNVWQLLLPSFPPQYSAIVDLVFTGVASYFHLATAVKMGASN